MDNKLAYPIRDFAQAFGMTTRQAYRFIESENIQIVRIGKAIYVPKQAILNYVKGKKGGENESKNQQGTLNIS